MYETFFQLHQRPFAAAPQSGHFFPAQGIDTARQTLVRIVARAEGAGLIIGPSGTGKTLLCQSLADAFRDRLSIALLSSGRICTRRALLQAILFELRLPYRGMEEGELRLSLIDHLTPGPGGHPGLLLLVDEAHTLPIRLLEELRMITNLVRDGQPRVRLILAGSPALEERFASPKLDSFSQRLAARCYLAAMNREETTGYARYQIAAVGGDPDRVFESSAYESIFRATDGIPRLVNQVCDHALILSALGECRWVTGAAIEEAWGDLQQLPTPWQTGSTQRDAPPAVVEFAPLDEMQDDSPAIPFPAPPVPYLPQGPDQQLEQIEQQLADIDEDFQPAGSIGPEIELVFNETSDPFGEAFDEEEVVIDRYASLEADLFAERPAVKSLEGSELSQLLTPWMNRAAEPTLTMNPAGRINPQSPEPLEMQPVSPKDDDRRSMPASDRTQPSWAAATQSTPSQDSQVNWIHRADTQSSSAGCTTTTAAAPGPPAAETICASLADDADLIIVEDDIAVAGQPTAPPLVRRQEYRQLFTRLRRG